MISEFICMTLHSITVTDFLWCCILRYIIITSDCLLPLAVSQLGTCGISAFAGHSTTANSQFSLSLSTLHRPDAILRGPNLMNNLAGVLIRVQAERHHTVATWGHLLAKMMDMRPLYFGALLKTPESNSHNNKFSTANQSKFCGFFHVTPVLFSVTP